MHKSLVKFFIAFFLIFIVDQAIKMIFIDGFSWEGEFFSLVLTYNKGVAFSMFAFLDEWLKFIQIALILGVFVYLVVEKKLLCSHAIWLGALLGAGIDLSMAASWITSFGTSGLTLRSLTSLM